jgi:hypothetical protein
VIAQSKSYCGVSCAFCGEPIPVSNKVVSLQNEIAQGERNVPHAFTARCQVCEHESVYEIKGLQRFDGEPPRRAGRPRRARAA